MDTKVVGSTVGASVGSAGSSAPGIRTAHTVFFAVRQVELVHTSTGQVHRRRRCRGWGLLPSRQPQRFRKNSGSS